MKYNRQILPAALLLGGLASLAAGWALWTAARTAYPAQAGAANYSGRRTNVVRAVPKIPAATLATTATGGLATTATGAPATAAASFRATIPAPAAARPAAANAYTDGAASPLVPPAAQLVRAAAEAIGRHRWVSARVRHRAEVLGHEMVGSGVYQQERSESGLRLRMELRGQIGSQATTVLQVCDGEYLWTHTDTGKKITVARVDLARIRRAVADRAIAPTSASAHVPASWSVTAFGGLPKLLEALASEFEFNGTERAQLDRVGVWSIRGTWAPASLAAMLPAQREAILAGGEPDWTKLPLHVPHEVTIDLGTADLFPYRIEYRRWAPTGDESSVRGGAAEPVPILTVELFEVNISAPIPARQFEYHPGDHMPIDETERYLARLGIEE